MKKIYKKFLSKVQGYTWNTFDVAEISWRLDQAESSDLPLIYSLIIEIIKRVTDLTLFDSQITAAYAMQQGKIVQLPTGEGKTLAAVLTAVTAALQGHQVHIFTINDYLAKRDYMQNQTIYQQCGLTCSYIDEKMDLWQKKKAYESDVLYITAKQAGFDYLRNFLCTDPQNYLKNPFDLVLIDEADSILIDEAQIPLVIASDCSEIVSYAEKVDDFVRKLQARHFDRKTLSLTETGVDEAESFFQVHNLYEVRNIELLTAINDALEAHYKLKRDVDYIVKDQIIMVIDQNTGRTPLNRKFPAQLHRAIELKENLLCGQTTSICNSMPLQFFIMQYNGICGMTGTAEEAKKTLATNYGLQIEIIPPHLPCIRIDHPDLIFDTDEARNHALLQHLCSCHDDGQPVLVGTQSVEESEMLSGLLKEKNISHHVLNARNDNQEAEIIKAAGNAFAVTISTNMAGRGVDIKLDDKARAAGGLFVCGLGINESRRIDRQLCGRSGRQGDPGESRFFISRQEKIWQQYSEMDLRKMQKIREGQGAEHRYMLNKYAYVQELHRQKITAYREELLFGTQSEKQQIELFVINQHWSDYLCTMENIRNSIHLVVLGGLNPIEEYNKAAAKAFEEMIADIDKDVCLYSEREKNSEDFQNHLKALGLGRPAATYSYQIDESRSQFTKSRRRT